MFKLSRLLIIYAIAIPLALILGFLTTAPGTFSYAVVGLLLFFFALPIFLRWHHFLMIVFWNSCFIATFLPGQADFWIVFAAMSFGISMLNHIMFQKRFLRAPELTKPLLCMGAVVLGTAWLRGGIGIRAMGSDVYGGRKYLYIFLAIAGYFALTAEKIPIQKGRKMAALYFGSGITFVLTNLIYMMGPFFYWLYVIVPVGAAYDQAYGDMGLTSVYRVLGLGPAAISGLCLLLALYGVRGLFDWGKPWRFVFLCATVGMAFFAGYRGVIVTLFAIFAIEFYFEGLLHTNLLPIIIGMALFGLIPVVLFSNKMPTAVQRAISYLPVKVDSDVLEDAHASTNWRLGMWGDVAKELPKYLILGKGYAIDPNELAFLSLAAQNGVQIESYSGSLLAGDYHSGPLSVIIPFGIFGVITFVWVLIGGYRVLSSNYRFGDARLRRVNSVLLAFYITSSLTFFGTFGAFSAQLYVFLGACGMSISLNGGVKRKAAPKPLPVPEPETLVMEPG